jgi:hypothetical protein
METKGKKKEVGLLFFVGGWWTLFANAVAAKEVMEYFFGHSTSEIYIMALFVGAFLGCLLSFGFAKDGLESEN